MSRNGELSGKVKGRIWLERFPNKTLAKKIYGERIAIIKLLASLPMI